MIDTYCCYCAYLIPLLFSSLLPSHFIQNYIFGGLIHTEISKFYVKDIFS